MSLLLDGLHPGTSSALLTQGLLSASSLAPAQPTVLPLYRVFVVIADDRDFTVAADNRLFQPVNDRTFKA